MSADGFLTALNDILLSLRTASLSCILINLPSYRSASFVSLGVPFVVSVRALESNCPSLTPGSTTYELHDLVQVR